MRKELKFDGLFVTGTHTGAGKTLASAILTQAFEADYWKPVQAGNLKKTDSDIVKQLTDHHKIGIHPESYRLKLAASPHAAAAKEHILIELSGFRKPKTKNRLIVEGAGGVLVPLNDQEMIIDLMSYLKLPIILVSQNYLGSINHTMLTLEALSYRNLPVLGIIFNGKKNEESERYIETRSRVPVLYRIPRLKHIDKETIAEQAQFFREALAEKIDQGLFSEREFQ